MFAFTVYGPRQRPDLAIHKFAQRILRGETIEVYGEGNSKRDYTFVSDIVDGVLQSLTYNCSGYDIINGRSDPVVLLEMINVLENALGKKAKVEHREFQTGDMPYTLANIDKARNLLNYKPSVKFEDGIQTFVDWFIKQQSIARARNW